MGIEVAVNVIAASDWQEKDCVGTYNSFTSEIQLLKRADSLTEHAFFHELMHAILTAMGQDKLNKNEAFVDMAAGLLHQALTSARHKA